MKHLDYVSRMPTMSDFNRLVDAINKIMDTAVMKKELVDYQWEAMYVSPNDIRTDGDVSSSSYMALVRDEGELKIFLEEWMPPKNITQDIENLLEMDKAVIIKIIPKKISEDSDGIGKITTITSTIVSKKQEPQKQEEATIVVPETIAIENNPVEVKSKGNKKGRTAKGWSIKKK